MKIDIKTIGIAMDPALHQFIAGVAMPAFATHDKRIERLQVQLSEVTEPREGKNRSCLVKVIMPGGQKVITQIMDSDLRVAIHRAIDRAGWTTARWLQRRQREAACYLPGRAA